MALTGLDIYKLLPKTNCGDCGSPTCLAFAMKLASKQAELQSCPHASEEATAALGAASQPPIRLVTIGAGDNRVEIGNETVLFRHQETFYHQTALAVRVREDDPEREARLEKIAGLRFTRVGEEIAVDLAALEEESGDPEKFAAFALRAGELSGLPAVLISSSLPCLGAALEKIGKSRPLICPRSPEKIEDFAALAREHSCPLAVDGGSVEKTAELSLRAREAGAEDLVLLAGSGSLKEKLADLTVIRRQALRKQFRPLGYPTIAFTNPDADPEAQALEAAVLIAKYAGVVVTDLIRPEYILPLLTVRQNIYTDPQKPIQVEPKLYPVGTPDRNSPLLVTTNFSLTYFTVEGEIEASRIGAYLLVVDTEGTSVLTAWAADKFNAASISRALNDSGAADLLDHRNLILPGYVAVLSGKVEEESGWTVEVGPREASGIPKFLKTAYRGGTGKDQS
ncbi:MAG: acetyl-CoA decarbonylase/synthase complex subunit gamma [Candidatus Erginobacter occultus]|nr:acetyl-CoA decarbonylase/synthase complex subunit gamma [Candidatus Erginobacter occultus]